MVDRSSRPHRCPHRTPTRIERRIIKVRVTRRWGPARIAYLLGLHPSTVHRVLARYRMARLAWMDRATGRVIRRYEHAAPGELVHVDVKKLGKIPDGGGWRVHGRAVGTANKHKHRPGNHPVIGYHFLHSAIDDHSRLAYSELLPNEQGATAAAFWTRARAWFTAQGITIARVLTDNGACYRSRAFAAAVGTAAHKRTRPYRPQTNGKVERFNRTLLEEWAYARPTAQTANDAKLSHSGSTTTTTTAATPHWQAYRRQPASLTCRVITTRRRPRAIVQPTLRAIVG
jgi:transposase InsO family protein